MPEIATEGDKQGSRKAVDEKVTTLCRTKNANKTDNGVKPSGCTVRRGLMLRRHRENCGGASAYSRRYFCDHASKPLTLCAPTSEAKLKKILKINAAMNIETGVREQGTGIRVYIPVKKSHESG